jgi:hypothetical protein
MKVKDLIRQLAILPQDADVFCIWDGGPRSSPEVVWLTKDGRAMLADFEEPVHDQNDRPPNIEEARYWRTPK